METYITKLKHILPTFFIIAFSTIIGLLLFRWLFVIQFDIIDIKEEVWCLWLPMGLPWLPILIWLRPRFRILTFKKDNDNGCFFFQLLSAGTIIACLLVSQSYLTTASGKLKQLSTISDIDKTKKARYYKLANFSVAPNYGGSFTDFRTSGKYNQHLNFDVYFVIPILKDTSETITDTPKYWYGVKFKQQISNKISPEEKESKYEAFYNECIDKIKKYDFYSLDHFERRPTSDDRQNYLNAIEARTKQTTDESFIVLEPIKEKYAERNGNKFAWIFGTFGIGLSILFFALIWPGYSETEKKRFLTAKKPKQDDLVDMLNYLVPKGDHFATSIILDLNIIVFLLMVFSGIHIISPNGMELLQWGANRRLETTGGEWWRLLTSIFMHGGIMHLFLNISGLVIAAIFVEPLLGRKNYLILYILSGLCGSLASILWYPNTISFGASGAIFGLYGAILGLLLTNTFPEGGKKGILMMIGIYVGLNLIWGLTGGIDNAAHIGGLLSGSLIGIILHKIDSVQKNEV